MVKKRCALGFAVLPGVSPKVEIARQRERERERGYLSKTAVGLLAANGCVSFFHSLSLSLFPCLFLNFCVSSVPSFYSPSYISCLVSKHQGESLHALDTLLCNFQTPRLKEKEFVSAEKEKRKKKFPIPSDPIVYITYS